MSAQDFSGRCVVLTGAAGNLGRAVADVFASRGASLVLVDRDERALRAAFGADTPQRVCLAADLLDAAQARAALDAAVTRFERVHVLCNLAGGFRMGEAVHETSPATWEFLWGLNVRTLLHMAQAVVPHMAAQGGGRIVNVGAFSALRGGAAMGAYGAAKSAVIRLTEAMSAELKEQGINVNCVLPTIIDTPENRAAMPNADPARWVAPADLARAIAFLASDDARAVHGAALPVTGLS
ncbi:MAG TPA: SDR family oxidoreductase [Burkholderiaceae bacterium]|nr:SDR family oxidoreductase [Burkholderiaceae bacterium]